MAFFGTPEFAVPTLERLLAGRHPVVVVVTQPDRPRGRGRRSSPSPVAEAAARAGIPVLRPERVGDPEVAEQLRGFEPDLGVVVAFGQFLPKRIREAPRLGYLINAHASLLPRLRGAAPIPHAILEGADETGVSVMRIQREMDAGPVGGVRRTAIEPTLTGGELSHRLGALAADAVADVVEEIADGRVCWTPQDESRATFAPKLSRESARIDWTQPAVALERLVRAMAPRPGAFSELAGEPLRILAARVIPARADAEPGTVRRDANPPVCVATGDGWLTPTVLQRPGKRALGVAEFLRGCAIPDGSRLGADDGSRVD